MILPFVRELLADAERSPAFQRAAPPLKAGAGRIRLGGLTPTAKALYLPLLQRAVGRPLIVVASDNRSAEELLPVVQTLAELSGATDPAGIFIFPAHDVLPYQNLSPHPEVQEKQAIALWKIATGAASIVIVPAVASLQRFRAAEYYAQLARVVRRGESIDVEALVQHLNTVGYTKSDVVEMPGEYALRGGILDAYPPEAERPLRIEFFGDEVDSIRPFDPATQRSAPGAGGDEVVLLPLTPVPVTDEMVGPIHARLSGQRLVGSAELLEETAVALGATVFPGWELYAPLAGAENDFFDLLPHAAVIVDEPSAVTQNVDAWWERVAELHERSGVGALAPPHELYVPPDSWREALAKLPGGSMEQLAMGVDAIEFASQATTRFHGSVAAMIEEINKLTRSGADVVPSSGQQTESETDEPQPEPPPASEREAERRVVFCAANTGEVERLADIFSEYNVPFRLGTRAARPGESFVEETSYFTGEFAATTLVRGYVPEGVVLPDVGLVIFGTRDLFDESETPVVAQPLKQKSKVGTFLSDFRDLAVGDYVVHVEHGIGQYQGLREIAQADGSAAEFMILEYAEGARLYVPLTRLDLVQKYRSAEGARPALSRLGTQQWAKTKARVKKAMKDMADELLKLYAARKTAAGHAFPGDTEWQREFEDAFEFNETDDQAQAIVDVKRDMQQPTPMDRLLCGDVGYGKTEVAMRAAFKSVSDNKQVAVLAPTTVLAFQHYETFKRRMAQFPIKIEMLSRFRTTKQQKEIVEKVEAGQVDILIGTHRLLSKDLKFHDLGLVVVDEEQRFGVRHKERLKQLKREVDVLTMSATPIPRTLHMSLVGLRDMSVIETPPRDRIAIETVVAAWDEKLVQSAIERELERGGQVYFLHNRVESIYEIAAKLQEWVPRARIIVGHGQMSEGELEKVMLAFMRHEADVLVATTIIENGLDIPLCNTILINRADRFGLSELYQLRGRVGRSNRRAYAFLMVPADAELTPLARRRLAALKEFSDLGAGFKIAALDLELRGAGNMLGGEQSGHIDAVGFELYTSMLERTIKEMKGEDVPSETHAQLNLGLNIRIPNQYIPEENQRLRMYKRVAGVENEQQLADVRAEMEDRYGPAPPPVQNLEQYAALKLLCERIGVAAIDRKRDQVSIKFTETATINPERLAQFVARERGAQFTPQGVLKFALRNTQPDQVLARLRELLAELAGEPVAV